MVAPSGASRRSAQARIAPSEHPENNPWKTANPRKLWKSGGGIAIPSRHKMRYGNGARLPFEPAGPQFRNSEMNLLDRRHAQETTAAHTAFSVMRLISGRLPMRTGTPLVPSPRDT